MKTIMANIWGAQKKVHLGTWAEIRKYGFLPSHRAFGTLNNGQQALFFHTGTFLWEKPNVRKYPRWYVTTETYEEICRKELWYHTLDMIRMTEPSLIVYS